MRFNPYFAGSYSGSVSVIFNNCWLFPVSILILLEVILEVHMAAPAVLSDIIVSILILLEVILEGRMGDALQ